VSLEKCQMEALSTRSACERDAETTHDRHIDAAKVKLDLIDKAG